MGKACRICCTLASLGGTCGMEPLVQQGLMAEDEDDIEELDVVSSTRYVHPLRLVGSRS